MIQVFDLEEQNDDVNRESWLEGRAKRRGCRKEVRDGRQAADPYMAKLSGGKAAKQRNTTRLADSVIDSTAADDDRVEEAEDMEDEDKQVKLKDGRNYRRNQVRRGALRCRNVVRVSDWVSAQEHVASWLPPCLTRLCYRFMDGVVFGAWCRLSFGAYTVLKCDQRPVLTEKQCEYDLQQETVEEAQRNETRKW